MYAVIATGGKQHRVSIGEVLRVEKLAADVGSEVIFDQVLALGEGEKLNIGKPLVAGAKVKAVVVEEGRGDKIKIVKYKRRKHHEKWQGHRQWYTAVEIKAIEE